MSDQATLAGDSRELEDLFDSIAGSQPVAKAPAAAPVAPREPEAGDNAELEDLFDSIASAQPAPKAPAAAPVAPRESNTDDSPELENLFDRIAGAPHAAEDTTPAAGEPGDHDVPSRSAADKVINSVGHLTRQLHDTLAELGYDRHLQECAAATLPDARQRLAYVVTLTEQAASRSLNAVEVATPVQEALASEATSLAGRWDGIFRGEGDVQQFKALAEATRGYLQSVAGRTETTREQLREIMMAQEFQDLTGQVLKRITELANNLETQLLTLLVENSPTPIKRPEALGLLNGPAVGGPSADVVANQAQVDELLESLGF
jgi:chemotaxis protein CheZ